MLRSLLRIAAVLILPAFVFAQDPPTPPIAFSGTFVSVTGDIVTLQNNDGKSFTVQMTPGWTVSANRAGTANDIRTGDFVATTNVPVSATTVRSTELRILEPGYRPEEGTHVASPTSPNMMTHGTVKSASPTDAGVELEITYPSGSRMILVPPGIPVTISDPLDHSILTPGVMVSGVTRIGADGIPRASRLQLANK